MRRVLYISYCFPPLRVAEAVQAIRFAQGIRECGWLPTILTVDPRTTRFSSDSSAKREDLEVLRIPAFEPRWLTSLCWRFCPSLLVVPDEQRFWARRAARAALRLAGKRSFEVLLTRSCPFTCHLAGLAVKRASGLPWVAHFSDMWTTNPYFVRLSSWQVRYNERLEQRVVKAADRLTITGEYKRDIMFARYPASVREKCTVIPDAADLRQRPARTKAERPRRGLPLQLLHAGNLYGPRSASVLVEAASRINLERPGALRLRFLGHIEPEERRRLLDIASPNTMDLLDPVDTGDVLDYAAAADVLVSIDAPTNGPNPFLPSKLYDYLLVARPILALTPPNGATRDFIRQAGGICASPDDPVEIGAVLRGMLAKFERGETPGPLPDRRFIEEQDIHNIAPRLCAILNEAADS